MFKKHSVYIFSKTSELNHIMFISRDKGIHRTSWAWMLWYINVHTPTHNIPIQKKIDQIAIEWSVFGKFWSFYDISGIGKHVLELCNLTEIASHTFLSSLHTFTHSKPFKSWKFLANSLSFLINWVSWTMYTYR